MGITGGSICSSDSQAPTYYTQKYVKIFYPIENKEFFECDRYSACCRSERLKKGRVWSLSGPSYFTRFPFYSAGKNPSRDTVSPKVGGRADETGRNNCRLPNGELFELVVTAALAHSVSRQWKGYWQRGTHYR